MSLSLTMLASDFDHMRDDLPQTITFSGASYAAVVTDFEGPSEELDLAGVTPQFTFEAIVLRSEFSTLPGVGDKLTYSATDYRIVGFSDSADSLCRTLRCQEVTA